MIVKTKNLIIKDMTEEDIKGLLEVYNSNQDFLMFHIDKQCVSMDWLIQEQKEMKSTNFRTLIAKENKDNTVIGFIDILFTEECYLSLLMVHNEFKSIGYGKEIYDALEDYLRGGNFKSIRIDVAYDYNEAVLRFWRNRGFVEVEKIRLQWTDNLFDAIIMKKNFQEERA